jgi:hypothetical protein
MNETVESMKTSCKNETVESMKTSCKSETVESMKTSCKNETVESMKTSCKNETVESMKTSCKSETVESMKTSCKSETVESMNASCKNETVESMDAVCKKGDINKEKKQKQKQLIWLNFIPCHESLIVRFHVVGCSPTEFHVRVDDMSTGKNVYNIRTNKTTVAIYPLCSSNSNNNNYCLTITSVEEGESQITNQRRFRLLDRLPTSLKHIGYYHAATQCKDYGNIYKDKVSACDWTTTNQIFIDEEILSLAEKSNTQVMIDTRWMFFEGTPCTFVSNWKIRWEHNYKPLLKQYERTISCFMLDECFWSLGLTDERLQQWITILKNDFPTIPLLLIFAYPLLFDGGVDTFKDKLVPIGHIHIPKQIDWIGYDKYGMDEEEMYKNHEILKKVSMSSNDQKLVVVAQCARIDTNQTLEEADATCLINNAYYWNLCYEDKDIIGCMFFLHSVGENNEWLGAKNLPDTYAFQQYMGKKIKNKNNNENEK